MKKEKRSADVATHDHTIFFDTLINLIPSKFYLPSADADDDNEKPFFHALTVAEKAAHKKNSRDNLKKAREIRLDPKKPSSTTVQILEKPHQTAQTDAGDGAGDDSGTDDGGDDGDGVGGNSVGGGSGGGDGNCDSNGGGGEGERVAEKRSATYEELRTKLWSRIEEFRAARDAPDMSGSGGGGRGRRYDQRKRRRQQHEERENAAEVAAEGLRFGKVKVGAEEEERRRNGRNDSKKAKLERLEKGKKDDAWEVAGKRAAGEKVHDNPKLLKKSIGKERRRKEKSRKEWADRVEAIKEKREKRQKKRKENIAQRILQKRRRKIERREKKLMHPGSAKAKG